ncbi:hypothetical protein KCP71_23360 [Salmonella enterica subsp. enterica]|nr:hypothetical protein KCP71_23360 [Salmonella enterica subsp. enterica]
MLAPVTGGKTPLHRPPSADGQTTSVLAEAANSRRLPAPVPNDRSCRHCEMPSQRPTAGKIRWKLQRQFL